MHFLIFSPSLTFWQYIIPYPRRVCQIQADSSSGSALPHTATARSRCRTMESANGLARRICAVESCVPSATATADKIHFIFLICTIPQMPAVLGQSTSFALNGPPFTSMANQQNAATNRGDRASACDEVACVKTALGFNKKKPHPEFGVRVRERCLEPPTPTHPFTTFNISSKMDFASFFVTR